MVQKLAVLLQNPKIRYLIVGGSVYAVELAIILVAQHLGAGPLVAVTISYITGMLLSFGLQKLITFRDKRLHGKVIVPQFIATCVLVAFNLGFTLLLVQLLSAVLYPVVVRTIALSITTIWNFYLYKTRIFKSSELFDIA